MWADELITTLASLAVTDEAEYVHKKRRVIKPTPEIFSIHHLSETTTRSISTPPETAGLYKIKYLRRKGN